MRDLLQVNFTLLVSLFVHVQYDYIGAIAFFGKGLLIVTGIVANAMVVRKNWKKHD